MSDRGINPMEGSPTIPPDDMPAPTPAQAAVLRWLRLYPAVRIHWTGGGRDRDPLILPWWRDDAARRHMVDTVALLGTEADVNPAHPAGGTPRLTWPTFRVLLRHQWIRVVGRRQPRPGWSPMAYYQLGDRGRYALGLTARPGGGGREGRLA